MRGSLGKLLICYVLEASDWIACQHVSLIAGVADLSGPLPLQVVAAVGMSRTLQKGFKPLLGLSIAALETQLDDCRYLLLPRDAADWTYSLHTCGFVLSCDELMRSISLLGHGNWLQRHGRLLDPLGL